MPEALRKAEVATSDVKPGMPEKEAETEAVIVDEVEAEARDEVEAENEAQSGQMPEQMPEASKKTDEAKAKVEAVMPEV
jgi:hypothetical protein